MFGRLILREGRFLDLFDARAEHIVTGNIIHATVTLLDLRRAALIAGAGMAVRPVPAVRGFTS